MEQMSIDQVSLNPTGILLLLASITVFLGGTALFSHWVTRNSKGSWALQKTPLAVTVGTTFAAAVGGGVMTFHVGLGYDYGWSVLAYGFAQAFGIFLIITIAKWLRENEFQSLPAVFEKLYGKSKTLVVFVALAAIITPFGWVAGQCVAFGKLFSNLTGIPMEVMTIACACGCLLFVLPSGFATVAWADAVFGYFMAASCILTIFLSFNMAGGWSNIVATVPREMTRMPSALWYVGGSQVALWMMSVMPGCLCNQMYMQRVCAVERLKDARKSLVFSCLMIMGAEVFAGCLGLAIRTMMPGLEAESATGWFLTQLPLWFTALFCGLIGAAIMSTCNGSVQSVVVNVVYDIYQKVINPDADEKALKRYSRISCVVVLFIAVVLGLLCPSVLDLIVYGYAYGVSVILVPMFGGYFLRNKRFVTRTGCYVSMICGLLGSFIFHLKGTTIPFVMFGLIFGIVGLLVGSALTRKSFYAENMGSEEAL